MTRASTSPTVSLTSPEELLGALPYLLGFHPEESLTTLFLTHDRVQLTLRVDLPDVEHAPGLTEWLTGMLERVDADTAVAVISSVHAARWQDELTHVVEAVETAMQEATVTLLDIIAEDRRTYRSCLLGGPVVPFADDTLPVSDGLAEEVSPARSRGEAMSQFDRIPGLIDDASYGQAVEAITGSSLGKRARLSIAVIDKISECMTREPALALRDSALLGVLLCDVRVRDHVVWTLSTQDDQQVAERRAAALLWAALRQHDDYASQVEAAAGTIEYLLNGNGLHAMTLLGRAVDRDENQMAQLTTILIRIGTSPKELRSMLVSLSVQDILRRPQGPGGGPETAGEPATPGEDNAPDRPE